MRVGISGHQRIPAEAFGYVNAGIFEILSDIPAELVGISSLAAGSDQMFAARVLELGGKLRIIVPCMNYEETFENERDRQQFRFFLTRAESIKTLGFLKPSESAFLEAGRQIVEDSEILIAVWDGRPAKGKGGTADIVEYAKQRGIQIRIVWPTGIYR